MRKQQSGMSPYPGHHPDSKEMQLWQQHLMYKQLQELRRQQQLQQLNQGTREQNLPGQAATRQATINLSPSFLNGMPVNDTSHYMLPKDMIGVEPKTSSSAPMFMADDPNWTQSRGSPGMHGSNRVVVMNDHVHAMRPAGFVPQQPDRSLYGTPISTSRGLLNQFTQYQGMPNDLTDVAKAVRDQLEKVSTQSVPSNSIRKDQCVPEAFFQGGLSVATQGFQGKGSFGNAPVQRLSGIATLGSIEQVNNPEQTNQSHVLQNVQEQACWSRNLEESTTTRGGPPRGLTSLDPTEEKILFGTDDDGERGSSFERTNNMGIRGFLHGDSFEGSDQLDVFPSLQSGSWSALMQEAVQSSSSDKGVQEEWSGLSFQKAEQSVGTMHNDIIKHQATWDNNSNNFQGTSSSVILNPSPSFNDTSSGPALSTAPSILHSTETAYQENNIVQNDASHKSFHQSSEDDRDMHFDQSHRQKLVLDGGRQVKSNDVPHGIWSSVKSAESRNMDTLQSNQDAWIHQESIPLSDTNRQPCGGSSSHVSDNNKTLYAQNGGNLCRGMEPVRSDIGSSHNQSVASPRSNFGAVVSSNTSNVSQEMNQHTPNSYQVDPGKHVAFDSFVKSRGENVEEYKHQLSKGQQVQDSSVNSTNPSPSMSDSQTSSGMSGWKSVGSRKHQSHPTENFGMNMEHADSPKGTRYSQSMPKLVIQPSTYHEQRYMENSRFASHGVPNMGKAHSTDLQISIDSPEDSQCISTTRQTSKNMLELLHKVDSSRDSNSAACFGISNPSLGHNTHEAGTVHGSTLHSQHHQSPAFPGFNLQLPSPAHQRQIPNHDLFSQTSLHDSSRRQLDSEAGERDQTQSASTGSDHSLHNVHEESQRRNIESRSESDQRFKETSQLICQGNSSAVNAANFSYMVRQLQLQRQQQLLQEQHMSNLTGREVMNQSGNFTSGSHATAKEHTKHVSVLKQAQFTHDVASTEQAFQKSLSSIAGRILPFRLDSLADAKGPGSHLNSADAMNSQPANAGFHNLKNAPQQLPLAETRAFLQACARSDISQQVGYSPMLQNVWTNTSSQPLMSASHLQKPISNIPQSPVLLTSRGEKTSGAVQMEDDRGNRGIPLSELGPCSSNSQRFENEGKHPAVEDTWQGADSARGNDVSGTDRASKGQDHPPKHHSARDSAVPISSLGYFPHDVSRGNQWPNVTVSNTDARHFGPTVPPTNTQQPNYSLLRQMQDMRGQNVVCRVPLAHELGTSSDNAFPSDPNVFSFSSRESREKSADGTSQIAGREKPSWNTCLPGQPHPQRQIQQYSSSPHFIGRNEDPLLTSQMASSWIEQYKKYKNGQILAMYADQRSAKASSQQYLPADVLARTDAVALAEQRIEANRFDALSQGTPACDRAANESSDELPYGITCHDMVIRSKKHKTATEELPPWHRVVSLGGIQVLRSISTAECDWAHAADRLAEKAEDAADMLEDGSWIPRARRRLILTTQLMQQLFPSIPAPILTAEATSSHESITYFLAKSVLGDACSEVSCSGNDTVEYLRQENRTCGKRKTPEKASEVFFLKVAGDLIGRSQKLETEFSRLDKRTSILDVRLEWQEVEKFSLINRLGKFHGRSPADGAESSSTSQNAPCKIIPQRYVTAYSLHGNVPEGVHCLSL